MRPSPTKWVTVVKGGPWRWWGFWFGVELAWVRGGWWWCNYQPKLNPGGGGVGLGRHG